MPGLEADTQNMAVSHATRLKASILIQSCFRSWSVRAGIERQHKAAKTIQRHYGRYRWKRRKKDHNKQGAAAIKIQASYRGYLARREIQGQREAATTIQRVFRRYSLTKKIILPGSGSWLLEESELRAPAAFVRGPILRPNSGVKRQRPLLPIGTNATKDLAGRNPALFDRLEVEGRPEETSFDTIMMRSSSTLENIVAADDTQSVSGSVGSGAGGQHSPLLTRRATSASPDRLSRSRVESNRVSSASSSRRRPPASAPPAGRSATSPGAVSLNHRSNTSGRQQGLPHTAQNYQRDQRGKDGWRGTRSITGSSSSSSSRNATTRRMSTNGGDYGNGNDSGNFNDSINGDRATLRMLPKTLTSTMDFDNYTNNVAVTASIEHLQTLPTSADLRAASSTSVLPGLLLWPPPKTVSPLPNPDPNRRHGNDTFWQPTTGPTGFGRRWK